MKSARFTLGSNGNDRLASSFGDNLTFGLGGDDTLSGVNSNSDSPGIQYLHGGNGSDRFELFIGDDFGGSGIDTEFATDNKYSESFIKVLDYSQDDSLIIDLSGLPQSALDGLQIERYSIGDSRYSDIYINDLAGTGNLVATVTGSEYVVHSDVFG